MAITGLFKARRERSLLIWSQPTAQNILACCRNIELVRYLVEQVLWLSSTAEERPLVHVKEKSGNVWLHATFKTSRHGSPTV